MLERGSLNASNSLPAAIFPWPFDGDPVPSVFAAFGGTCLDIEDDGLNDGMFIPKIFFLAL